MTVEVHVDDFGEGPTRLLFENTNLFADMEAAQATFDVTGGHELLSCMKCANCVEKLVLTDTPFPLRNPNGGLVEFTSPTLDAFSPNNDEATFVNANVLQCLSRLDLTKAFLKGRTQLADGGGLWY